MPKAKKSRDDSPPPMWARKVRRLLAGRTISSIERAAGWPRNTLHTAMSCTENPSIPKAESLAKALNVRLTWLFNDGYPVDSAAPPFADENLSPGVMRGLAERLHAAIANYADEMDGDPDARRLGDEVQRRILARHLASPATSPRRAAEDER